MKPYTALTLSAGSLFLATSLLTTALTGCGAMPTEGYQQSALSGNNTFQPLADPTSTATPTPTPTRRTGIPPLTATISGTGYSAYTSTPITVSTNSILKIKFRAGQPTCLNNTNYCPRYSRLGVFVGVGTMTEPTGMISNGFYSAAEESQVINLSAKFTHTCAITNPSCRQSVTLQIEKPNTDTLCLGVSGCWTKIPDGHPWNGTVVIETDDTDSI